MTSYSGLYLYAIAPAIDTIDFCGINDASVDLVEDGDIAAVVSPVDCGKIRPQRKNLAAHQAVLKYLMSLTTPLPVKFGIIADDEQMVRKLLEHYQDSFSEQLAYFNNTVEMGLRLNWNVPNIFEYLVSTHAELQAVSERLSDNGNIASSRDEMIEVGYRFSQVLDSERQRHTETAQTVLSACCLDTKTNALRKENEVMNLACLVSKDKLALFTLVTQMEFDFLSTLFGRDYAAVQHL